MLNIIRHRREENRLADQLAREERAEANAIIENLKIDDFNIPIMGEEAWTEEDRKTAEVTVKREAEARLQESVYIDGMTNSEMLDEEERLGQMADRRAEYMAELAAEMYEPEGAEFQM